MKEELKKLVIESLKDQMEIFGDNLFEDINSRKTAIIYTENSEETFPGENVSEAVSPLPDNNAAEWQQASALDELENLINTCKKCPLHEGRTNFVFGTGNPDADVMVIGEGPGAEEDKQGKPFVGRAGQLLTDILKAIKFSREEVYIANVVKCRPPGNRTPLPNEMDKCLPYLRKQIHLIKPKLILCLGLTAAQGILGKKDSLSKLRGNVYDFEGTKVMITFHPAALLRNPNWKRDCWEDVKKFRKLYEDVLGITTE